MRLRDQHPQTVFIKELDVTRYQKLSTFVDDIKVMLSTSFLNRAEFNVNIPCSP